MTSKQDYKQLLSELERLREENYFLQRQLEKSTTHSQRDLMTDHLHEWIWEVDENGVYTYASAQVAKVLGYRPDELIGKTPFDFMEPDEARRVGANFEAIASEQRSFSKLFNVVLKKDGTSIYTETSGRPVYDKFGRFCGYRGIDFDRTDEFTSLLELKEQRTSLEKALHLQNRLLQNVANTIPDLFFYKDRDFRYIGCNETFCTFVGRTKEEILGKDDFEIFPEESAQLFRSMDSRVIESRQTHSNYEWVVAADGRRLYLQAKKSPLFDEEGSVIGLVGISRDLTLQQRLEDELQQANVQLNEAQRIAKIGHWKWDIANDTLSWSDEVYRIFGYAPHSFKPDYDVFVRHIHADDQQAVKNAVGKALNDCSDYDTFHRIVLPDGQERTVHEIGQTIYGTDALPQQMIGTIQDVTDLKKIEHDLQQQKEAFETIFEYSSDGLLLIEDSQFVACNQAMVKMLHADSKAHFLAHHPAELSPEFQPDGRPSYEKAEEMMKICLEKGQNHFEWVHKRFTGEEFWSEILLTRITINDKPIIHVSWRDISDRKKLEHDLETSNTQYRILVEELDNHVKEQSARMLKQSQLAQMGELISMIAHQWRQPLGAIAAVISNLKLKLAFIEESKGEATSGFQDYLLKRLDEMESYTLTLSSTIDDFRNLYNTSKAASARPLTEPIERSLSLITRSFNEHHIQVDKVYAAQMDVRMHGSEIMQVLLNLLRNAEDNFIEREIEPRVITITTSADETHAHIRVCDNGGGITPEVEAKIFDPYFSTKSDKNGTGLGLYMCKIIIEKHHNGALTMHNTGGGVCFTITLPL